jgi:hypothetical protein
MKAKWVIALAIAITAQTTLAAVHSERMKDIVFGKRGTVLIFVSSMCPCTDQHRLLVKKLVETTRSSGVSYYCVFSNASETESKVQMFYRNIGWEMPYLLDSEGFLARKYKASHTPQVIAFNSQKQIIYRGPIDDSSQNQGRVLHPYLPDQVDLMLSGNPTDLVEVPPLGCWLVTKDDIAKNALP